MLHPDRRYNIPPPRKEASDDREWTADLSEEHEDPLLLDTWLSASPRPLKCTHHYPLSNKLGLAVHEKSRLYL